MRATLGRAVMTVMTVMTVTKAYPKGALGWCQSSAGEYVDRQRDAEVVTGGSEDFLGGVPLR